MSNTELIMTPHDVFSQGLRAAVVARYMTSLTYDRL